MSLSSRKHRIEKMDDRHMTTSISLVNGDLMIEGSSSDDQVTVSEYNITDLRGTVELCNAHQ